MHPLPQTRQVLVALAATGGDGLEDGLAAVADQIGALVPSCVGVSLSVAGTDLTLTFVASTPLATVLDAVQGAHGGPCVAAPLLTHDVPVPDVLDEDRWREYAAAAAAEGVRSSLSMPLVDRAGVVTAAVNVYAAEPHAFDGLVDALHQALGPLAAHVTTNADLAFTTRDRAEATPRRMAEHSVVATAVGCLVAQHRVTPGAAQVLLEQRAARDGVDQVTAAQAVLDEVAGGPPG